MRDRRFGMPIEEWRAAATELRTMLGEAASRRATVTYGEAARRVFGGRFSARSSALMALLSEVDTEAHESTGVFIATLVVRADTGRPGEGYFAFAERAEGRPLPDREAYWLEQAERVWRRFARGGTA